MIRKTLSLALALLFATSTFAAAETTQKGTFVAIGGGQETPEILQTLLRCVGGPDRRVVVMPLASDDPAGSGEAYKQFFASAGIPNVESMVLADRDAAQQIGPVKDIGNADMLYFTGGDQTRLANLLANTAVDGAIQAAWRRQAVIAGTSAGAMVWGPEFIANGTSQGALKFGFSRDSRGVPGLDLRPGLDLWDHLIIDTRFTDQERLGRLLLAVASTPGSTGLGIDEGTAAVITPETIQVVGSGSVTVLESDQISGNNAQFVGPGTPLGVGNVVLHRLIPGMTYLRKKRRVEEALPLGPATALPPVAPMIALAGSDVPRPSMTSMRDFIRASGGTEARLLMLTGDMASKAADRWRAFLLKSGAEQVVNYQAIELSDQGLAIALQHATGILLLEDDQASLLHALNAHEDRFRNVLLEACTRMPVAAAGNAVRIVGARALFGTPGQPDYQSLPGLGLLPSAILVKNFWTPASMDRMVRAQLEASRSLAIGLSPDNSLTLSGGQASVSGESQVIFLDANHATALHLAPDDSNHLSGAGNLELSVVPPGGSYDLMHHQATF